MSKNKLYSLFAVGALSLGLTIPAGATTVTVSPGPFSPSGSTTTDFNSGTTPVNYVEFGPSSGVVSGNLMNQYSAPTGDATPYAYVGANSFIAMGFTAQPITSFGFYWGSIDSFNGIAFTDTNGVVTSYGFNGTAALSSILPASIIDTATSEYVTFETTGAAWKSVLITSGAAAFEFDNVSVTTPEPVSLALMGFGLLAIGAGARRRKSSK